MSQYIIRGIIDSDKSFIYSTWLRGLYFGNDWFEEIPGVIFFKQYAKLIDEIMSMPECRTQVACLPDAEDVILGYSIIAPDTVHWVFVKDSWRRLGIAKALVPKETHTCTQLTKVGKSLKRKYALTFNPFIKGEIL